MLRIQNKKVVEVSEWDRLVEEVYGKPYNFQQQDGCKSRGTHDLGVPTGWETTGDDEEYELDGNWDYVPLKVWISKDPKTFPEGEEYDKYEWQRNIFWERDFYPDIDEIADDLYKRGLLKEGSYLINIDW